MNPDTGAIARFETDEDAALAGFTEKLTEEQYQQLAPMNRHERRKWLSQSKKKNKRAQSRR